MATSPDSVTCAGADRDRHKTRPSRPSRAACERCHRYKEKCVYDAGQQSCSSCRRLDKECRLRQRKRMGRQPIPKTFSYGNYSVISLKIGPQRPETGGQERLTGDDEDGSPKPKPPSTGSKSPRQYASDHADDTEAIIEAWPLTSSCLLKPPGHHYRFVDHMLVTNEAFFHSHRHFMIGRTFISDYRTAVQLAFYRSPEILADTYFAAMDLMRRAERPARNLDGHDLSMGTQSVRHLMHASSSIQRVEDAATTLLLGQLLLVYNTLIPFGAARTVTRGALLAVKPWFPALARRPDLDCATVPLVLMDTAESLIRRDMPVVRLAITGRCVVERFLGVCSSLLPLLYDLCERSYQLKTASSRGHTFAESGRYDENPYLEIECRIRAWTPVCPPDLESSYSPTEVRAMLAQARLYRTTALLIIHRLRFPLGVEDGVAYLYAESLLDELAGLTTWPTEGATGLGLDFPLFVAMVEMPDRGEEIFRAYEPIRYRKLPTESIMEFIRDIRKARDLGYDRSWLDLAPTAPRLSKTDSSSSSSSSKRRSLRTKAHERLANPLLPRKLHRENNTVTDSFLNTKLDKRLIKRSSFVSRITKSSRPSAPAAGEKQLRRRRPSKKLVATLESLADALPELTEEDGRADEALKQGRVRHRSLRSRPGALKRKERVVKGEIERFGASLAQLVGVKEVEGDDKMEEVAETGGNGGDNKVPASAPAPAQVSTANRFAALRGFISATMELNPAFASKG